MTGIWVGGMTRVSRRGVLKAGGLGVATLAGCTGGGDGGTASVAVGVPSASTTTGQASNAFQRVVQEQSPDTEPAGAIQWNSQETGGDPPSIRQYNRGNLQAMTGGNFIVASAKADLPPFQQQPVESLPHQAMSITTLHMHVVAVEGSGIETTDDLAGADFWPLPPSWGLRRQAQIVLESAGLWSELQETDSIVNADTGDVAGAIEENRIDALMAYGSGFANLAGWLSEVDARTNLRLVEMTDSFRQGIADVRGTSYSEVDVYGWENQRFDSGTMDVYDAEFQFWFGSEIPRDVGYELAKISSENTGAITEGQPAYADHSDPANIASLYLDDHPVHPGVYDYLEEQAVDVSAHTRGEVQR